MAQNKQAANIADLDTVLVTRFSAFGDVAMVVPVLYSACRCYPHIKFVLLTRPQMTSIFVDAPANLEVRGVDVKEEYAGIKGLNRLVGELCESYRPQLLVDLHNVLRTRIIGLLLRLKGIPAVHLYKPRAQQRELTRRNNKVLLPVESQIERYGDTFARAGLPVTEHFSGLFGSRGAAPTEAFAAVTAPKPEGEIWLGIAPFAAHSGKIYPPELMEKVLAHIQADASAGRKVRVFLFGGGGEERTTLEAWESLYPVATSLAGKRYGFGVELALLNHIDGMVAMDSANMHLAALAGTPTVSVWGATHPYCGFLAWNQTEENTVQASLPCRPCSVFGNKPCYRGDMLCLKAIRPDTIYNALARVAGISDKQ
ncbi:MAG: glycosyltransferase family 9 protein [Bacteroidales bacterium]|nr:glycosyltransferase family 9 protein [Bacteroidales bacterium]